MPSKTFLGLPEEKKAKIIVAAREAFSEAPYSEVTITDIIKLAEIPRGSFYQYFKDKEDIYFYLLETFRQDFKESLLRNLESQHGDLFAAIRLTYHETLEFLSSAVDQRLLQNIFMEMDYRGYQHLLKRDLPYPAHKKHQLGLSEWQQSIKDQTDFTKLRVSQDEFDILLHMLLGFMGQSVARYFVAQRREPQHQFSSAHYEKQFALLLDWFEHGVLKENLGRELND